MSNKMKKLISTLLCGAMLLSSVSLSVFADEAVPTAETTAAPAAEATAAPEATVETTTTLSSAASDDSYFNEAVGLLSALKIFEGYEDGSIKPEASITRAEMAAVILRTLGNTSLTKYTEGLFTDVSGHWAADTIQTAADLGIINGMGDGTFAPDAPVKYEQAVKMAICALGYGAYAEANGGYPMGYLTLAGRTDINIVKQVNGAVGQDAKRGDVVKLIYNTINAPFPTITGFDVMGPIYSTSDDKTIASDIHDVYISEGILTGTYNKSIDVGSELTETQISIDGDVFESTIKNADELVGQYVKAYYYDPTGNGGAETVIFATPKLNKNDIVLIDALDIDEVSVYTDGKAPTIKYLTEKKSKKTAKIVNDPIIVYNNEVLTYDQLPSTMPTDEDGNDLYTSWDAYYNDFIKPDAGSIQLGDFDKDGKYDIVMVEKYSTFVVNSASDKKVTLKYAVEGVKTFDMDLEDSKYKIDLTRDGEVIKPRHLKEYNVISALMNAAYLDPAYTGDRKIKAVTTTATFTGTASAFDDDGEGHYFVKVGGKQYNVDSAAVDDVRDSVGSESVFYIDQFDRIAYVESSGVGKLSGSERYGWITNVYTKSGSDDLSCKIYTDKGTVETYEFDSTIDFWDKTGRDSKFDTKENADKLKALKNASAYERMGGTGAAIRLCKYKVNSENLITKLYLANSKEDKETSKAVTVDTRNLNGTLSIGSLLNGWKLNGDVMQIEVPNNDADVNDYSTYKIETVAGSRYLNYENGCGDDVVLAEFDKGKPTIAIKFVGSSDVAANANDYDTAGDNPVMIVSKVLKSVNEDDETVYVIKGYIGAGEVEYTTKTKTVLRKLQSKFEGSGDKTLWEGTDIWNGKTDDDLRDVLKKGDICGVQAGEIFIKMVSIDDVVADIVAGNRDNTNQFYGDIGKSATRDRILFGQVTDVTTDTSATIQTDMGLREVTLDTAITTVEVSIKKDGSYSAEFTNEAQSVFDLDEGDYVFMRLFKNGAQREIYCIRLAD